MKINTIDKILLEAGYTKETLDKYQNLGITNGCGGSKGFNFTKFANEKIKKFPKFNTEFYRKLIEDLKYICHLHDLEYILGDDIIDKLLADLMMIIRLCRLLHWTTKTKRRLTAGAIFTGLTL
jgi:hypothetical protein